VTAASPSKSTIADSSQAVAWQVITSPLARSAAVSSPPPGSTSPRATLATQVPHDPARQE
jgi:hypothetical protein